MKIGNTEIPNSAVLIAFLILIVLLLLCMNKKEKEEMTEPEVPTDLKNIGSISIVYGITCPHSITFMGEEIKNGGIGGEAKKLLKLCKEEGIKCFYHESQTKEAFELRNKYNLRYVPSIVINKGENTHVEVGAGLTSESIMNTYKNLEKIKEKEKQQQEEARKNAKKVLNASNSGRELIVYYGPWCYYSRLFVGKEIVPVYDGVENKSNGEVNTINTWAKQNDYKMTLVNHKIYDQEARNDGARGYPHSVIKKDGSIIGSIGGYLPAEKFIERLNKETAPKIKQTNNENGNKIIIVYAPWCIWSKRLCGNHVISDYNGSFRGRGPEGEYPYIKNECNKRGFDVELVDATRDKRRANQLGVNGFPNIIKMIDGNVVDTIGGYMGTDQIISKFF